MADRSPTSRSSAVWCLPTVHCCLPPSVKTLQMHTRFPRVLLAVWMACRWTGSQSEPAMERSGRDQAWEGCLGFISAAVETGSAAVSHVWTEEYVKNTSVEVSNPRSSIVALKVKIQMTYLIDPLELKWMDVFCDTNVNQWQLSAWNAVVDASYCSSHSCGFLLSIHQHRPSGTFHILPAQRSLRT